MLLLLAMPGKVPLYYEQFCLLLGMIVIRGGHTCSSMGQEQGMVEEAAV